MDKIIGISNRKLDIIHELYLNKRIIKHNDTVKLFTTRNKESNSFRVFKGYVFWKILHKRKVEHLPYHCIVWFAHNGSLDNTFQIDHIDRVRGNNSITNLRLATWSENCINSSRGYLPERRNEIRDLINSKKETIRGLSRKTGISRNTIQNFFMTFILILIIWHRFALIEQ